MPVYLHFANLLVSKEAVHNKYSGGLEQFRLDYRINSDNENEEDVDLFSIAKMNIDEFDIDHLIAKGLQYDTELNRSDDFTIKSRYGSYLWATNWIVDNEIFAWHINTPQEQIDKAQTIANTTLDKLEEMYNNGTNPFATIK